MKKICGGFSLVEVVIALAVAAFALLTMVALLPAGIKSNKVSVQETTAAAILTMLQADMRNTHPLLNSGKSQFFGLTLPYISDASGNYSVNTALAVNTVVNTSTLFYMTGVAEDGSAVGGTATPKPFYQATIVYTRVVQATTAASMAPVEARLIVNWPYVTTTTVSDLTNPTKVTGFLDAYVAFPCP